MIALDSSALIAIALGESEREAFEDVIQVRQHTLLGYPTLFETRLVLTGRLGADAADTIVALLIDPGWTLIAFDDAHLAAATSAMKRFGRGRHPAKLNFGDCMAYAVAAQADCPLLYKGDDFARTDIRSAL